MTGSQWTAAEKEVVDESWDPVDAWENYRAKFGMNTRTWDGIKRRWYRVHCKVSE